VLADFHVFAEPPPVSAAERERTGDLARRLEVDQLMPAPESGVAPNEAQRRRLAMLAAEITDRPIRIYDGWTDGQAPRFHDLFHHFLVPEQRGRGRTLVIVGDAAALAGCVDRVVRMEDGKLSDADPGGAP
jgi:putative ATP-binding cassette transporter